MKELVIVGAGSAAREILQIAKYMNKHEHQWLIKGFIADTGDDIRALTNGEFEILGTINDWRPSENEVFVCAIADPKGRERVVRKLESRGADFINFIHYSVGINDYCTIGKGVILHPGSSIGPNAIVGDHVMISKTDVPHDSVIGDFTTLSAMCSLLGKVKIGKRVFIGSHAVILPSLSIGDDAVVGAGSIVVKNVKANTKVFGNPAKKFD